MSQSIFNRTKFNLNDRYIRVNPLNFCPKIKCPILNCPKFLVFNVFRIYSAMDSKKVILIVVLVVLFCVVFVAAGGLMKVRNSRQSNNTPTDSGFDNKGMDA